MQGTVMALLASLSLFFFCSISPMFCLNSDGFSLLALKSAVTLDPHRSLFGWRESDDDPCSWAGVVCSDNGRVSEISLPEKGLTGYIPSELGFLLTLQRLSLRRNNFSNPIPARLFAIPTLVSLDLSHNSLTGPVSDRIRDLKNLAFLDLSSNFLNGSLPVSLAELPALSGSLNLSNNHFSGPVPSAFGRFPVSLSLDFRQNNLSGPIPQIGSLLNQGPTAFTGNPHLCGFPLQTPCRDPTAQSSQNPKHPQQKPPLNPSTVSATDPENPTLSSPADKKSNGGGGSDRGGRVFPTIPILSGVLFVAIAIAASTCLIRKKWAAAGGTVKARGKEKHKRDNISAASSGAGAGGATTEEEEEEYEWKQSGELRVLDEGFVMELEELLRASAYVVGKSRSGIVYKVVVGKGVAVAVRRLSEGLGGRRADREFEAEVETMGRVRHPNLVRLRAYYLARDERLLVSDYIPNGTLHCALHAGTPSPPSLPWAVRLKIAQGAARGIAYIHECSPRRYVHGNIKSSKILLGEDYHPCISGFGLACLVSGAYKPTDSVYKKKSFHSAVPPLKHNLLAPTVASYIAPEARTGGSCHTQKCDVYAFGIVLLEILTGRLPDPCPELNDMDLEGFVRQAFKAERPLSDIVDPSLLHEVYAKKQVLATFHIALGCAEPDPEIRPRMKAISECLDRIDCH